MSEWRELRSQLLKDEEFRREYERLGPLYELISQVMSLRNERGLTQAELAEKMGRQQPAIARLESGRANPTLAFLVDLAEALDARLAVSLVPKDQGGRRSVSQSSGFGSRKKAPSRG